MWYLYLSFILFASVSSNSAPQTRESGSSIDALIQRLKLDRWTHEEAPCLQKMLILLDNVKNHTLWASWVWNANSLPTGNMYASWSNFGNYDQCMKPPWLHTHPELKTKYCVGKMVIPGEVKRVFEFDPYGSSEELINVTSVSSNSAPQTRESGSSIDALIQRLKLDRWTHEEAPCLQKMLILLDNVKNHTLWASWVWNANSLPTGNMYASWSNFGNYDQCMKPPWLHTHPELKTKYCVGKMVIPGEVKRVFEFDPYGSSEELINSPTRSGLPVNLMVWGLCVPAACDTRGAERLGAALCDVSACAPRAPDIEMDHCLTAGDTTQYTSDFYIFVALMVSLMLIAAASTYYRSHIAKDDQPPDSIETIITKSFCLKKNSEDLMKENKDEISVMNGMRFLTAVTVVSVHNLFYTVMVGMANGRDYDKILEGVGGIFLHIDIIVDTFFAMSGLLHIKGLMANIKKPQNLFSVLWKRYVRLIGPFAIIVYYLISVSKHTGSGPLWIWGNKIEGDVCAQTWRSSLLMLNSDPKYICHAVTWYIPCDYQLAILGTVLFYFYKKNRRLGLAAFGISAVVSLIIPGVLTYWYQLPVVHFTDLRKLLNEMRDYWEIGHTYTPSYSRAGAYLVGVAMGYLMILYKPADYRKSVSLTLSVVGTAVSLTTMVVVMFLGQYYLLREYAPIEAAVVAATNRIVWAVAICCIIGFCEYGTVPIVSNILSFPAFGPLSRLSYSMYIIHPLVIQRKTFIQRAPLTYDLYTIVFDSIGILVLSISLSFGMWLLVEAPLINLTNNLMFNKSKSMQTDKVTEKNGNIAHQNGTGKSKVT
uniref:Uncharacterized protein n=1 Tax=Heliothis virescens TaxID=7102 RepID=A0A2A4JXW1_HELVI